MKNLIAKISIILLIVFVLSSCNTDTQETPGNTSVSSESETELKSSDSSFEEENLTADMFFSYKENAKYVYDGYGNEYAAFTVYVDFMNPDSVQTRTNNGGTEVVKVIQNFGDKIILVRQQEEIYFRENFLEGNMAYLEILLIEPIAVGTKWEIDSSRERSITAINKETSTPYGTFKAIEVTTISKESPENIILDYYVKDLGHVKSIFKSAEGVEAEYEIVSELSQIIENKKLVQNVDFYFPDFEKESLFIYTRNLEFSTNDSTVDLFEKEFRNLPDGFDGKLFSENTSINFITRKDNETAHIDFSEELITEMNSGAGFESMIIQSIVNTIAGYYGVEKVYISVVGSPYSSGHIQIGENEFFQKNLSNSVLP